MAAPGPASILTTLAAAQPLFKGGGAFDLISIDDVRLELNLTTATDAWLQKLITRLSAVVNQYCNRVLVAQTYRERVWPFRDAYPWQSPTRTDPLQLARWPVVATPSPSGTAPPPTPTLSAASGGSLAVRTYSVRLSFLTPNGETAAGPDAQILVPAGSLASVAPPGPDRFALATGWNVYAGAPGAETLQNSAPLSLAMTWTEPSTGLVAGQALPPYLLMVENVNLPFRPASTLGPTPLAEGIEFIVAADVGQVARLFSDGYTQTWPMAPLEAIYTAGFTAATMPPDLQDALLNFVKARYFARLRDPMIRQETIAGIGEMSYWFGTGPDPDSTLPPNVEDIIENYRVPVAA